MRPDLDPFHAIAISRLAHQLKSEGRSVIHMEFGQPSTGAPKAAIECAHHVLDTDGLGYWESPALKARIARHYDDKHGVHVDPEQIILTCGASPALVMALASAFEAGDRVALARPGYVAYRNTLKALNLVPVEIACGPEDRYQLTAAHLAALDPAPAGVIVADQTDQNSLAAQGRDIAGHIAGPAQHRGFTFDGDHRHGGFRRDAVDGAIDEAVQHHVAQHQHGLASEGVGQLGQGVVHEGAARLEAGLAVTSRAGPRRTARHGFRPDRGGQGG